MNCMTNYCFVITSSLSRAFYSFICPYCTSLFTGYVSLSAWLSAYCLSIMYTLSCWRMWVWYDKISFRHSIEAYSWPAVTSIKTLFVLALNCGTAYQTTQHLYYYSRILINVFLLYIETENDKFHNLIGKLS